jgi:hypothetical protein
VYKNLATSEGRVKFREGMLIKVLLYNTLNKKVITKVLNYII